MNSAIIHPTAIIHPDAQIAGDVDIGPFVVIEGAARIASGCRVDAHAQLVGEVQMGEGTSIGRAAIIGEAPQDLSFKRGTRSGVEIGKNCIIREHVTIHRSSTEGGMTRIGDGNYLMVGVHLGHDVALGEGNILANAALLAGHVTVGNQTFIGGGAVFHQFLRIGDSCVIQGNGSFSQDIPHYCRAQRMNRLVGLNVVGLRRQGFSAEGRSELKRLFALLFASDFNMNQAVAEARKTQWTPEAARLLEFVEAPSKKGICRHGRSRSDGY